ncbi:MAG TPA: hypothetical protein VHL11_06950 [Phototrophicaceae bacterium]|jgi:hypothetical protein|nr:hypothetical protein [Phototrophicaceae bacterium]
MQDLQKHMTWKAIPFAGLAGGTVFLLVNLVLTPLLLQLDSLLILRYFASLVMGSAVLTDTTSTTAALVGVLVNYALSIVFALVIALVIHRWGLLVGIIGGAILGLCIYAIDLYTMTRFFEWFFAINSPVLLISHVLYGAVVGAVYESFDHYDVPVRGGPMSGEVRS